jgi:hypothetical protein
MSIKYISLFLALGIAGLNATPDLWHGLTLDEYMRYLEARNPLFHCYKSWKGRFFGCDEYERVFEKTKNEILKPYVVKVEAIKTFIDEDTKEVRRKW